MWAENDENLIAGESGRNSVITIVLLNFVPIEKTYMAT